MSNSLLKKTDKIYVAGHRGLVGSALLRSLQQHGFTNIVTALHQEVDLTRQQDTEAFFAQEKPDYVVTAAAKVGGILANDSQPAHFIYDNIMIETNLIEAAHRYGVKKLLFLGSSCIYPKLCPQPIKEEYLLTGALEPTNAAYAVAKIAGIALCQAYRHQYGDDFIAVMPTNLYGINDNFDLTSSHVLPALLRKFHEAVAGGLASVTVWGSGHPRREFLYVDDLAEACLFLLQHYSASDIINIGTGRDVTIAELAALIADVTGFHGKIVYDTDKPDGTPVKRLDVSRLNALGWQAKTSLRQGIEKTYAWYVSEGRDRYYPG